MQQFRPLPSFDENGGANLVSARLREGFVGESVSAFQSQAPAIDPPLFRSTDRQPVPASTTDQLAAFAKNAPAATSGGYPSLVSALQSTMSGRTTGRMIIIPGAKKSGRLDASDAAAARHMSKRLRHAIVIIICLVVILLTLLTLTPLATGQGSIPLGTFSTWVRTAQLVWDVQAHQNAVTGPPALAQSPTGTGNLPSMQLPKSQYIAIAQQDAMAVGISPDYFVRQINQESGFNANAVSPAGAVGIAQFLPSTARGLGINPYDPIQALRAAANVMAGFSKMYGGDYAKALAAYNAGSGTVQNAVNNCGANWMNCIPAETRNYIRVIMGI